MTPDEARRLLAGTTPGPWEWVYCIGGGGVRHMALRNPSGDKAVITEDAESYQSGVTGTPEDLRLTAAAPTLAAMIAGMREEWIGQYLDHEGKWDTMYDYPTREEVAHHLDHGSWDAYTHTRITRRYVTEPEEIK